MKGQAPAYWIDAATLARGLFDSGSDAHTLLRMAACNSVELHATSKTWNMLLRLLVKDIGSFSGRQLGELRSNLPVIFH